MKRLKSKLHQNWRIFWKFGYLSISLYISGCRPEESLLALLVECWSKSRFLQLCFLATASYWNVCKKREKENQQDRPWRLGSVNFTTRVQNLTVTKPIRLELKSLEKLVNLIRLVRLTACCWSIWIKCLDQWKNNLLLASYQSKITKKLQTRAHSKSFSKTALAEEK